MGILSKAERLEVIKGKQDLFIGYDERMTDKYWLIARVEELEANLNGTTVVLDETIVSLIKMGNGNSRLREALNNILEVDEDYLQGDVNEMKYLARIALEETK